MDTNTEQNEIGTISGILIIVLVFVLGGFYFLGQRIEKQKEYQALRAESASSSTDDLDDIQKDAASLNFQNLGDGVNDLK